ncbi:MAG: helix-turn-helix transcriptional regulator [Gammaproteobacteria bacterium]|nr:helix-turn-helix transcriptional regulator [Gammaproteobacteria bacterium]
MSVRQVAEYLQVNEKKVYALASEGKIPGTKITGKWLFPRDLVDQWLLESSHGGVLTDRLVLAGSDDPLLHRVLGHLAAEIGARAFYSYTPTGTRLGLSLLSSGRVDACALHWGPVEESHLRHPALISSFQQHHQWVLVRAFLREQGLMVSPRLRDGPLSVEGLLQGRRRWVMRQEGAGSQRYLQEVLARHDTDIHTLEIVAHARSEHEAAACVAMEVGDVAPGVRAAARGAGLAFVSIGWEAFDFALYRGIYFRTLFQHLLDELKSPETQALAKLIGGYDLRDVGKLIWSTQD